VARALEAMDVSEVRRAKWTERWIVDGFNVLEPMIAQHGQGFAYGETPTIADCLLIPQVYSARRYKVDLAPYPAISAVAERAAQHHAFIAAHPDNQPDAVSPS
jgi:maleylacetoacetate isomerase